MNLLQNNYFIFITWTHKNLVRDLITLTSKAIKTCFQISGGISITNTFSNKYLTDFFLIDDKKQLLNTVRVNPKIVGSCYAWHKAKNSD